ncbi:MAG: hypothetical protein NT175_01800 [Bacteroidetes bacterium]|nr:hypothetical protein [Bacteroidota bacterium]
MKFKEEIGETNINNGLMHANLAYLHGKERARAKCEKERAASARREKRRVARSEKLIRISKYLKTFFCLGKKC